MRIKKKIYLTNIKLNFLILFLLLISFSKLGFGSSFFNLETNPSLEILDRDSGLSNLSVSSIVQDKYGFLWFGSQGGLNRYDGREVTVFRNDPFTDNGLIHNLIQTMYYDEDKHELWIGTYQGITRFDISKQSFQQYTVEKNNLSNAIVIAITKDRYNNIWAGTMSGLNKINPESGEIIKYKIPGNTVRDLTYDSTGRLLIGTYQGLCYFDQSENIVKKIELELPSPYVMVMKEFEKGILTIGMWGGGVAEINLQTKEVQVENFDDNRIYTITKTIDGTFWVGSWGGGLFAIKKNGEKINFTKEPLDGAFSHAVIYSMLEDNSGILWIGTNGNGIIKLNPRKQDYVKFSYDPKKKNSLKPGKVNNILKDSKGNLWIEVYDLGLNRYDYSTGIMHDFKHDPEDETSLGNDKISDIVEVSDGRILFATGNGISSYDYVSNHFNRWDILPKDIIVYSIVEDVESEILWIGTYTEGVYSYNEKTKELKNYKHNEGLSSKLSDNLVYDILLDSRRRLWVATNNGLNLYFPEEDKFKSYFKDNNNEHSLGSNAIRTLFETYSGELWIGTNGGGVSVYNERSDNFKTYVETDGLSSNTVSGILEGFNNKIWLSTTNGISILNPFTGEIDILTPDDGIGGWEFNSGGFRDEKGNLLFGGAHGVTIMPTDFSLEFKEAPKLYISDIKIFQNSLDPNKAFFNNERLVFSPKDNFVEFKFTALDYDAPEKIKFSYNLKGFNNEWVSIGTRDYVSFSNLKPGNYELMVAARTSKDIESKIESVYFTVQKPLYRTNLAYWLYFLIFIAFIWTALKMKERQLLHRKNSELARLNNELEEKNFELKRISIKDELTGLYNRRYFNTKINELLTLSKRSNTPLSLLMLDLDKFKSVNDVYGHLAGDNFLIDIGKEIEKILTRNTDFGVRYGGDEFAVLLYDTDEAGAKTVAKKIKDAVIKIKLRTEEGIIPNIHSTISIGIVSMIPYKDETFEEIIDFADKALYRAKEEGRNKICVYNDNLII